MIEKMDFNERSDDYSDNLDFAHLLMNVDRPTKRVDDPRMTDITDYRHELKLRDDSLRKELDLRQESFRAEQAVRDKALDEKFSSFLQSQANRDRAFEKRAEISDKASDVRFDRIDKDISSIKTDVKTLSTDVHGIRRWIAMYTGGIAVLAFIIGAAIKHFWV